MDALLLGDLPIGLFNRSTGDEINFLCTDPPLLWRCRDAAVIVVVTVACLVGCALLSWPWLLAGVPAVMLRTVVAVGVRMLWRWSIRAKVDAALAVETKAAQPRPRLRRVKSALPGEKSRRTLRRYIPPVASSPEACGVGAAPYMHRA